MKSEAKEKSMSWSDVPKAVWYFLDKDKGRFLFAFIILLIIFFYDLIPIYVVGKIVDFFTSYEQGESLRSFYLYTAFLGTSYIIASLIRLKSKNMLSIISHHSRARARILGFERLTEFSLEWHNKENTGSKLQKIFTGADALAGWSKLIRRDLLKIFASIFGVLVFFFVVDFKFLSFIILYSIVFMYVEFYFSKKMVDLSDEFNKLNQSAGGIYVESASNILSIKALGGERGVIGRVHDRETTSRDMSIRKANTGNFKWRCLQVVNGLGISIFLLLIGFGFIEGAVTLGSILVFYTYFQRLSNSLADISELHTDMIDLRSGLSQMMPIFKETEFIKTGNEKFPKDWDKIELTNALMEYQSNQIGLKDFNLTLKRNTKVGIAGSSGSGKSTLTKVILGLYALKSGEFKIGKKSYYSILHKETLSNITVVLQETELFNLSLSENITMMRPLDKNLLDKAIEISQLNNVIERLPEGLDATIGEKGYMLSGGERQRLGIARAIYKNAPIIILDEATSSLDSETEARVMEKLLGEYGKDKTFLIVAHRLGTLKYTDSISVMERGEVVESGSYNELMDNTNSVFHKMNQEQKVADK
ncbi:MAG: ABC transporter ATP-binding protein [Patescibacteria group bacterium]